MSRTLRAVGPLAGILAVAAGCAPRDDRVLVDVTAASGIEFVHDNGMSDELWFAEMMGGGVASVDIDSDGDQDLVFVQGQALDGPAQSSVRHAVYRNDLDPATGELVFADITATADLSSDSYAMGIAAGDVNNDGRVDLYVTAFGRNTLWLNRGGGRFERGDATVADERWAVSASFADLDADGWLDLYVGNYVDYRLANHKPCRSTTSARDYCSPTVYAPQGDALFRNVGDGRFVDVSTPSGVGRPAGGALGVIVADFDQDADADVYVANDGTPNLLWRNDGDWRFTNVADLSGASVNMGGAPEASMGLDAADYDGDGDVDLFMTHLSRESNTLYVNDGRGYFDDRSATTGLASTSLAFTGFGTRWVDLDGDGDLDLFSANGAVTRVQALIDAGDPYPLGQTNQVFELLDSGYVDASASFGASGRLAVSRGLALCDLNNDGAVDLVVANNRGAPEVLINRRVPSRWLGLDVRTRAGGRSALGATVTLTGGDGPRVRSVRRDGSYASSSDPRVVFAAVPDGASVTVRWPDGQSRRFSDLTPGRYHELHP